MDTRSKGKRSVNDKKSKYKKKKHQCIETYSDDSDFEDNAHDYYYHKKKTSK